MKRYSMDINDRITRAVAFYSAVFLFFLLLPVVLPYALGYHIDLAGLKIYKTGIIYLKSQPPGAFVYINGRPVTEPTPSRIEELKPGSYNVEVRKEGFYPWQKDLVVRPNMVTKAEEIVLFPITKEIHRIARQEVLHFAVSEKRCAYYITPIGLYRASLDGTNLKKLSSYSAWPDRIKGMLFSPDGNRALYFDDYNIWIIYFNSEDGTGSKGEGAIIEKIVQGEYPITNVFWYSQSNYVIFVAGKDINVAEVSRQGERNIVTLYKFTDKPGDLYYDIDSDSLYFIDMVKKGISDKRSHLYKLNLRETFFDQLMLKFRKPRDVQYEKR